MYSVCMVYLFFVMMDVCFIMREVISVRFAAGVTSTFDKYACFLSECVLVSFFVGK